MPTKKTITKTRRNLGDFNSLKDLLPKLTYKGKRAHFYT